MLLLPIALPQSGRRRHFTQEFPMSLTSPKLVAAILLGAGGLWLASLTSMASAQSMFRTASSYSYEEFDPIETACLAGHCPCPCPCPPGAAATEDGMAPPMGEEGAEVPEVADLDAGLASAGQSAAPNAIGDSIGHGGSYVLSYFGNVLSVAPGGGRKFKITENNSPIPQTRAYYTYNYFDNALFVNAAEIDVNRHTVGFEYAVWCNLASVEVQVPFSNSIDSELDFTFGTPSHLRDTEFGNVAVVLKGVLCQTCCKTVSAGLGLDLPTADDVIVYDFPDRFVLENDTVTLSPFLAALCADPCGCCFKQGYVQLALPLNENTVRFNSAKTHIEDATLLHLDYSVGYWLCQDGCGNGKALMAELHYTENLDGEEVLVAGPNALVRLDNNALNATFGLACVCDCWDVTPAVVVPLLDDPDRYFDYEFSVHVNRRF
jgi:hypothetical protein